MYAILLYHIVLPHSCMRACMGYSSWVLHCHPFFSFKAFLSASLRSLACRACRCPTFLSIYIYILIFSVISNIFVPSSWHFWKKVRLWSRSQMVQIIQIYICIHAIYKKLKYFWEIFTPESWFFFPLILYIFWCERKQR